MSSFLEPVFSHQHCFLCCPCLSCLITLLVFPIVCIWIVTLPYLQTQKASMVALCLAWTCCWLDLLRHSEHHNQSSMELQPFML